MQNMPSTLMLLQPISNAAAGLYPRPRHLWLPNPISCLRRRPSWDVPDTKLHASAQFHARCRHLHGQRIQPLAVPQAAPPARQLWLPTAIAVLLGYRGGLSSWSGRLRQRKPHSIRWGPRSVSRLHGRLQSARQLHVGPLAHEATALQRPSLRQRAHHLRQLRT